MLAVKMLLVGDYVDPGARTERGARLQKHRQRQDGWLVAQGIEGFSEVRLADPPCGASSQAPIDLACH